MVENIQSKSTVRLVVLYLPLFIDDCLRFGGTLHALRSHHQRINYLTSRSHTLLRQRDVRTKKHSSWILHRERLLSEGCSIGTVSGEGLDCLLTFLPTIGKISQLDKDNGRPHLLTKRQINVAKSFAGDLEA